MVRWVPGQGSPNRPFLMASQALWEEYHEQRRAIDVRWASIFGSPSWRLMVDSARESLREYTREAVANGQHGSYLIPI